MSKYGLFCPVARSLDVLGDRWTLLIIRNIMCGITHFNDLERSLPGISRSLLAQRLRVLQQTGVIEKQMKNGQRNSSDYRLTEAGQELRNIIMDMMIWGEAWACSEPEPGDNLNPVLLMSMLRSDVQTNKLPNNFVIVQFNFRGGSTETFWLLLTKDDVSLCLTDPGYEIDVLVTADLVAFYQILYGRISYTGALQDGSVTVEGLPALVRAFPAWFGWSIAAAIQNARAVRQLQPATA